MQMTRITAPTASVVTLEDVKAQARVVHGDDDAMLAGYAESAVRYMDGFDGVLGRALAPQTWEMVLDGFPAGAIDLPLGPVISLTSIVYLDHAGATQTLAPSTYRVSIAGGNACIVPVAAWPSTGAYPDAVQVRWQCGQAVAEIPAPVRLAAKLLAAHWYDNRSTEDVPPMIWSLINPYRRGWL